MFTETGGDDSGSDAVFGVNAARVENGVAQTSETLADESLLVERKGCVSAGNDGFEMRNGSCDLKRETDSVDGESDLETSGDEMENDSDAESEGFCENRDLDGPGKQKPKHENLKLSDSDLVWARVRSYPWWPGQVCDASVASKNAMKYFKKGNFLVAYFGDCSFAWNDVSLIKPFHQHFSQMVKQSNSAEFRDAIDCALEEVSRRVEFGLSWACVSEEAYNKLRTQNIMNPGIREDVRVRYGGDKLSNAIFFEPAKLVEYMKHLACFPRYDETDKLRFVNNRAQLLAFQQWKGYSNFPEYETFLRSVESAAHEASLPEPNTDEGIASKKRKIDDLRFDFEDRTDEKTKEKTSSNIVANKRFGSRSTEKLDGKSLSDRKRMVGSSDSGKSDKKTKNNRQKEDSASNNLSVGNKLQKAAEPCFAIGAIPLRVESEMNSLTPTLNTCSDYNSTSKVEVENKETKKPNLEELPQKKISSPVEMLLNLHSAKTRNKSFSIDHSSYEDFEMFIEELSCRNLNDESKKAMITETSEPRDVKDSSEEQILPDEMVLSLDNAKTQKGVPGSISIDHSNYEEFDNFLKEISCSNLNDDSKKASITETSEPSDVKDSSEHQLLPANKELTGSDSKQQTGLKDSSADSSAPNALILKFAASGSVPSEEKLNSIFNRYGPLRETETQVMKKAKRAKVVFKRGEDAETAFSSAGKYSIFGPSLLSYRLEYVRPKANQSNNTTNCYTL